MAQPLRTTAGSFTLANGPYPAKTLESARGNPQRWFLLTIGDAIEMGDEVPQFLRNDSESNRQLTQTHLLALNARVPWLGVPVGTIAGC